MHKHMNIYIYICEVSGSWDWYNSQGIPVGSVELPNTANPSPFLTTDPSWIQKMRDGERDLLLSEYTFQCPF